MTTLHRPRILRQNAAIRDLVQETRLCVEDLIYPLFIEEGEHIKKEIPSLPDYYRYSLDLAIKEVETIHQLGIKCILIFVKCEHELKDNSGTAAIDPNGLMQRSIRAIKKAVPSIYIMSDIALDPYSIYGHDGIVENQQIVNDATVDVLSKIAVSHAMAGADMVAPSDMMDQRIGAIRLALEKSNFQQVGIMAYSAKYSSCFYGPFRDALDSAPGFGDKKTYQMNPANRIEAIREVTLDIEQGADIVMIKPALSYLDIIREVKNMANIPVSAYHVSGEYTMIKAAAQKNWINEEQAIIETTLSIKRAGADLIATYFAKQLATILNS